MVEPNVPRSDAATEVRPGPPAGRDGSHAARPAEPPAPPAPPAESPAPSRPLRRWLILGAAVIGLAIGAYFLVPWLITTLNTVSTDDAYVNSHVTFVAPRVTGQVKRVLVDDNDHVRKDDLLVQLDPEPYRVQVEIRRAAAQAAETALASARAQVRATEALGRSQRWQLQNEMEKVNNQVALLQAKVAAYESSQATLKRARSDIERGEQLLSSKAISPEEYDVRLQNYRVAQAQAKQALEDVHQVRASLGLPPEPPRSKDLGAVPPDLDQTYSAVRTALAQLVQTAAQLGLPLANSNLTPREFLKKFEEQDPKGDIDRVLAQIVPNAPAVKEAQAKLLQARRDLEQAELNLRYCDVVSEIDGIVTRRNVNPGNNVQTGQSLMAVRSITEIWIDANFKETQLADLRIGQRARVEVDMYGSRQEFEGRITGFTMGTGQTLSLLPPQNATGNFVKIVQRLPVRIELTDYDPRRTPLFVGLSCTPYVYYKETPRGPHAGEFLRPPMALPRASATPPR